MGPATGEPPILTVHRDGRMDFEDLAVFVLMWNWYSAQTTAKLAPIISSKPGTTPAPAPGIRFSPGGDGTVTVMSDAPVDYLRLVVETAGGVDGVAFTGGEYWTGGGKGIVLTRARPGVSFEAAAVLLEDRGASAGGGLCLGRLRFGGTPGTPTYTSQTLGTQSGEVRIAYAYRILPGETISEGEAVLAAEEITAKPASFTLMQNSPNPFNPVTVIRFSLPEAAHVRLTVYTVTGQKAAVLADGLMPAGYHDVWWDAAGFPSGTYFYSCRADAHAETRRMLLLK
jgi:hypothetical protein